jgi:hypothetical protein
METRTAFDLNEHLAKWRDGLRNRPVICDEDIEELESHLRDTMDALLQARLSEEEAFLVAAHRVGHPVALEEQYRCAKPGTVWKERTQWMILGIVTLWVVSGLANLGSILTLFLGGALAHNGIVLGWIGLAVQTLLLLGFGWLSLRQIICAEPRSASGFSGPSQPGMLRLTISLSIAAVVISISTRLIQVLAVKVNDAVVFGGYYLVTGLGASVLTMTVVIAAGLWLGRAPGSMRHIRKMAQE